VWTSEGHGSDALTPLAWAGAHTRTIRLGTAVMQMAAQAPAMAALTIDHLSAAVLSSSWACPGQIRPNSPSAARN